MSADDLIARILASAAESVEAELLRQLGALPQVDSAGSMWFPGWVQIRVVLSEWTWDAQAEPSALIDTFAREHVREFSVTTRFEPAELRPNTPAIATSASSGDAQGERAHGDGTAAQDSAQGDVGGKR